MHPPEHVCRALHDIHPQLRLCWVGQPSKDDETNAGSFGICQLYHISNCGDLDEPTTFREFWNVETVLENGVYVRRRVDRGPLFSRYGDTRLDYDPAFRFPIFVAALDGSNGMPNTQDVFSGKFLEYVRHWLSPLQGRKSKANKKRYKDFKHRMDDLEAEIGRRGRFEWNKVGETSPTMAWKHAKPEVEKMYRKRERLDAEFKEMFKQ